ncbi:MAG: glycosyltransferase [FCB group bacterium]|nr:glycosyltransferase [FCB group bacterium]
MPAAVDIIIPHFQGDDKFNRCLETLFETDFDGFRVIVVDNGCQDDSVAAAQQQFPDIEVLKLPENLGFAGGCNAGVNYSDSEFIVLLNDDTEVDPGWLTHLYDKMNSDENIAAVQPKLRWIKDKSKFDYAGGMGGLMDVFGYPFCYGRIFETIEVDEGQYDWVDKIFWASGTATMFRRKLYLEAGGLDERFFAHQEEIDLNWRLQLMGYSINAVPQSVVYHYAGATLPTKSIQKKYLNHRNSVLMILKNYQLSTLLWVLPIRLALELSASILAVKQKDYRRILAIFGGGFWNLFHLPALIGSRKMVRKLRVIKDSVVLKRLYPGTIALKYYLLGNKVTSSFIQFTRNPGKKS